MKMQSEANSKLFGFEFLLLTARFPSCESGFQAMTCRHRHLDSNSEQMLPVSFVSGV